MKIEDYIEICEEKIKEQKEEKIEEDFNKVVGSLTDNQFWDYIRTWKDESNLCEQMKDWDIETKEKAIKEMKEIIEKKPIEINISEQELEELRNGEDFNWNYEGVDLHIFKGEEE